MKVRPPVIGQQLPDLGWDPSTVAWMIGAIEGSIFLIGVMTLAWLLGRGLARLIDRHLDRRELRRADVLLDEVGPPPWPTRPPVHVRWGGPDRGPR